MTLSFLFSCFPCIETGNETGSPSDVLSASLALCGTIISRLNCYPIIPLTKVLLLIIIEPSIFCSNGH